MNKQWPNKCTINIANNNINYIDTVNTFDSNFDKLLHIWVILTGSTLDPSIPAYNIIRAVQAKNGERI